MDDEQYLKILKQDTEMMRKIHEENKELYEQLSHTNEQLTAEKAWNAVSHELIMELANKLSQIWQIWANEPDYDVAMTKLSEIMDNDVTPLLMKAGLNEYGE